MIERTFWVPDVVYAQDAATAAGAFVGRLLFLVVGVVLLVLGYRRRQDPTTPSRGTGLLVAGGVLLLLFLGGLAGTAAQAGSVPTAG